MIQYSKLYMYLTGYCDSLHSGMNMWPEPKYTSELLTILNTVGDQGVSGSDTLVQGGSCGQYQR